MSVYVSTTAPELRKELCLFGLNASEFKTKVDLEIFFRKELPNVTLTNDSPLLALCFGT